MAMAARWQSGVGVLRHLPGAAVTPLALAAAGAADVLGGVRAHLAPDTSRDRADKWRRHATTGHSTPQPTPQPQLLQEHLIIPYHFTDVYRLYSRHSFGDLKNSRSRVFFSFDYYALNWTMTAQR